MAVRRGFRIEKQSRESKEQTSPQNPKPGKPPENVDVLVSRFLAELSDLSSEMHEAGNPVGGPAVGAEKKVNSPINLQTQTGAVQDAELEKINKEIEESLSKLEGMKPAVPKEASSQNNAVTEVPAAPAPVTAPADQEERAAVSAAVNPEEQAWDRLEVFRSSFAAPKPARRTPIALVLAGAVVLGILVVAGFYFFGSNNGVRNAAKETESAIQMAEPSTPPELKPVPQVVDKAPVLTESDKNRKSAEKTKPPAEESTKARSRSTTRTADMGTIRTSGSVAGSETKRSVETANTLPTPEKPKPEEQPPRQAVTPVAAVTAPPQQAAPAPTRVQPNPDTNSSSPAASVTATPSVRETPPAATKPAPSSTELPESSTQAKTRAAIQPEAIKRVSPVYPMLARTRRISGQVEVEAEISDNGDVFRAKAVSGPELLRSAAEEALMKWKFKPASVGGVNIPSKARISVNFSLH